jgi:integrase/ribosomal protein L32
MDPSETSRDENPGTESSIDYNPSADNLSGRSLEELLDEVDAETLDQRRHDRSTSDPSDMKRCPGCGSVKLHRKTGGPCGTRKPGDYRCDGCNHHFDEPVVADETADGTADVVTDGEYTMPGRAPSADTTEEKQNYPDATESTATRERALNAAEYERLLIGASRLGGGAGLEAWAAIVMLGRLGFRGGELTHFDASWVDHYEGVIEIPGHDPCTSGQDGGVCGKCKQAIRQRQEYGDDRPVEEITAEYWMPKTAAAVRSIPHEWSARTQEAVTTLVELHNGWPYSFSTLQRRVQHAMEAAPSLDEDATSTHGLRATAASYHAGNGLQKEALKQMMGWTSDRTPTRYLQINGQMTRRALAEVYR